MRKRSLTKTLAGKVNKDQFKVIPHPQFAGQKELIVNPSFKSWKIVQEDVDNDIAEIEEIS